MQNDPNLNKEIIDGLSKLEREKNLAGEKQICFTIKKAIKAVKTYNQKINSGEEAKKLKGIGDFIGKKIDEILKNSNQNQTNSNNLPPNSQMPLNPQNIQNFNSQNLPTLPFYNFMHLYPPILPNLISPSQQTPNPSQNTPTIETEKEILLFGSNYIPQNAFDWLKSIGFDFYWQKFEEAGYEDLKSITDMNEEDLNLIGISKPGHRRSILISSIELKKVKFKKFLRKKLNIFFLKKKDFITKSKETGK